MKILSHSRNYEDTILSKALHDVDRGFYVDVGCKDPNTDNSTKYFYDLGWNGINIEPNPRYFERLALARTRDINLNQGIAGFGGTRQCLFLDALSEPEFRLADEATSECSIVQTKVTHLDQVLESYRPNFQDIHFLKITVEDHEKQVFEGLNLNRFRPWIILVLSLTPARQEENYDSYESHLAQNGYEFVFSNGLYRFYLAKEHRQRKKLFEYPANVFGRETKYFRPDKSPQRKKQGREIINQLEILNDLFLEDRNKYRAEIRLIKKVVKEQYAKKNEALAWNHEHFLQLQTLKSSFSWRVTKPLRCFSVFFKFGLKENLKKYLKHFLVIVGKFINGRPILKKWALSIMSIFPHTKQKLTTMVISDLVLGQATNGNALHFHGLPPVAKQIFIRLKSEKEGIE